MIEEGEYRMRFDKVTGDLTVMEPSWKWMAMWLPAPVGKWFN